MAQPVRKVPKTSAADYAKQMKKYNTKNHHGRGFTKLTGPFLSLHVGHDNGFKFQTFFGFRRDDLVVSPFSFLFVIHVRVFQTIHNVLVFRIQQCTSTCIQQRGTSIEITAFAIGTHSQQCWKRAKKNNKTVSMSDAH